MAESSREEVAKLEALYANNPEGRVFTHLAEALRKAGELDRARGILQDGLGKHPTYASAHVVLGRVLLDQQQPDEAAESFRRVIALDPHNLVALRSLGDIARSAGRNEEAIGYFEQLKHHDPVNEEIDAIIAELSAPPAPAEPEAPAQPEEPAAADEWAAPEPEAEAEPTFASAAAAEPEPVSQEIDLDWVPDLDSGSDDGLPGDLGSLAALSASSAEPPQPELPTFAMPDNVGEIGSLDDGFGDAEQVADELPGFEDLNFDTDMTAEAEAEEETSENFELPTFDDFAAPEPEPESESEQEPLPEEEFVSESKPAAEAEPVSEEEPAGAEPIALVAAGEPIPEPEAEEGVFPEEEWLPPATPAAEQTAVAEPAEEPGGEVVTETIAELYTSQGLHDRAADVYRTLLGQRPGDPDLEAKLRGADAAAHAPSPPPEPAEAAEPAPWEEAVAAGIAAPSITPTAPEAIRPLAPAEPEPDAEGWLAAGAGTVASVPTPYAWEEEQAPEAQAETGPPITDYFRSLLSWKPAAPVAPPVVEPPPPPVEPAIVEPPPPPPVEPAAIEAQPPRADEEDPLQMLEQQAPPLSEPEPMPWEEPLAPAPPPLTAATVVEPEPMPWEEPLAAAPPVPAPEPTPPPVEAPAPQAGSNATTSEAAFDAWFASGEPESATPAPAAPAAEPTPVVPEGEAGGEDDDDLEMFRSWLQSLKK